VSRHLSYLFSPWFFLYFTIPINKKQEIFSCFFLPLGTDLSGNLLPKGTDLFGRFLPLGTDLAGRFVIASLILDSLGLCY